MTPTSRITSIAGRAIVLRGADLDTDRIIPARFLKAVTFDGLDAHVFEDDRRALTARGERHPFDDAARRGAAVLLAGANFGCGSSREHAPQALARWGLRAIVAASFAEIFTGNALMIGLPCVTAAPADLDRLMQLADAQPGLEFVVDLKSNRVQAGTLAVTANLPETARAAFLSGDWDSTGLLLERYEEVERATTRLPYLSGF
jgi:3-isopropylmalate/(R)-2-methylmalate dehydratase small subunit